MQHLPFRHVHPSSSKMPCDWKIPFFPPAYTVHKYSWHADIFHKMHIPSADLSYPEYLALWYKAFLFRLCPVVERNLKGLLYMDEPDNENLSDRTLFYDFPGVHNYNFISHIRHNSQIMRNQQNCHLQFFTAKLSFQPESAPGSLHPKMWLVHQQSTIWIRNQCDAIIILSRIPPDNSCEYFQDIFQHLQCLLTSAYDYFFLSSLEVVTA